MIGKSLKTHMVNTPGNEAAWVERARAWDDVVQKATTGNLNRVVARIQSEMSGFALELARGISVEARASRHSGRLDPSSYYQVNDLPREETGIIGNNTLPLSEELRAEVHQFYQESMRHARESGSLPYALSHAP